MSPLSNFFSTFFSIATYALELAIFVFALKRKLYRTLLFFFLYIIFLLSRDLLYLWISHTSLIGPIAYFYCYWTSEAILSILRLATVLEICWRALRPYPAVWALTWRILTILGIALILFGVNSARHNTSRPRYFVTTTMQRFELLQAVLLLAILAIGVYYEVYVTTLYKWVLIGICIYSSIQVANYELGHITAHPTNTAFDFVRRYSFTFTEVIWTWAVWRWGAAPGVPADLLSQQVYDEQSVRIHDRLRELNDRLSGLLRGNVLP
jgi:hypothetical protein